MKTKPVPEKVLTVILTKSEAEAVLALFDTAVRAGGLEVAEHAVKLRKKFDIAFDKAQAKP